MAKKPRQVVCKHCLLQQDQVLKQTFVGFFRFDCEHCQKRTQYPMSTLYVVIYAISALVFVVTLAVSALALGETTPVCGLLGVVGIGALVKQFTLSRQVRDIESRARTRGDLAADTFR